MQLQEQDDPEAGKDAAGGGEGRKSQLDSFASGSSSTSLSFHSFPPHPSSFSSFDLESTHVKIRVDRDDPL